MRRVLALIAVLGFVVGGGVAPASADEPTYLCDISGPVTIEHVVVYASPTSGVFYEYRWHVSASGVCTDPSGVEHPMGFSGRTGQGPHMGLCPTAGVVPGTDPTAGPANMSFTGYGTFKGQSLLWAQMDWELPTLSASASAITISGYRTFGSWSGAGVQLNRILLKCPTPTSQSANGRFVFTWTGS